MLKAGRQLSELGNISAALADVVQESTSFITACYGYEKLNNVRCSVQDVKSEHCKSQYCFRTKVDVSTLKELIVSTKCTDSPLAMLHLEIL